MSYYRNLLVFTGIFTFLVDAYPQYAASSLAANSFVRSSFAGTFYSLYSCPIVPPLCRFATNEINSKQTQQLSVSLTLFPAVFPLFGVQMYNKLGYQWATSVLAFLTVAMMPFPYLFFKYGKRIRARSRFAKPK